MNSLRILCLLSVLSCVHSWSKADVAWLPADVPPAPAEGPALCPRDFVTPAVGAEILLAAEAAYPTRGDWVGYGELVKQRIRDGAGLTPWPRSLGAEPILHSVREFDGYSVANVALETVPGYWATGNLYRPLGREGPFPIVLTTHGHSGGGLDKPGGLANHGRFGPSVQVRAATLARMGAIVFAVDMFGYGDNQVALGSSAHRSVAAFPLHLVNGTRLLDWLLALPDADASRVAMTGASGGGTQTFMLTALDERIGVSVPVVMVSSYFFGGCACESGVPVHRSADHFASNAMVAALAAPRPMLVISDGKDWTQYTPQTEFPFLQRIYAQAGAPDHVGNAHFPDEGHDYGPNKRAAMYAFVARELALDASAVDETRCTMQAPEALRVFDETHPLPSHAATTPEAVLEALKSLQ
ncbi:alpha/beta hydrolase family protein [Actomonas aquatica]|uniref:CocE/NonD family hydrolase n=1 Tax=Actomonas aquatica TaxID=2866162 RepID=A0ABZ1C991_9BACT|nr:CocE/NonD family hydrolase [Opitutus sp. WL0086]WRQ88258.1 CocE/NonD family hydrolase [Opitutus sp. WL0086]